MRTTWAEPTDTPDTPIDEYEAMGYNLAQHALTHTFEHARNYCESKRVHLEKTDEPELTRRQARLALKREEREEAKTLLATKPALDLVALGYKRRFYLGVTILLWIVGVILAHISVAPFALGWEAWVLSVGLGVIGMVGLSVALEEIKDGRFVLMLAVFSVTGCLLLSGILGVLRADIFAFNLSTAVSPTGESAPDVSNLARRFYEHARLELAAAFVLFGLATELLAGYTLHKFWSMHLAPEKAYETAQKTVQRLEKEMPDEYAELLSIQNRPQVRESAIKSGLHRGFLEMGSRFLILVLSVSLCVATLGGSASAQTLDLLIGVDLTRSVSARGYDEKSAYEKNCRGALELLDHLPPGSRVTVAAITDHSFSSPLILARGEIASEHGPLSLLDERTASRQRLALALAKECRSRQPVFASSDILGFLSLASELLGHVSGKKILILFSDMRQSGDGLDFNSPSHFAPDQLSRDLARAPSADLNGVDVFVLGVDAAGKDIAYWKDLKSFWTRYFARAGATLREYALTQDLPDLFR